MNCTDLFVESWDMTVDMVLTMPRLCAENPHNQVDAAFIVYADMLNLRTCNLSASGMEVDPFGKLRAVMYDFSNDLMLYGDEKRECMPESKLKAYGRDLWDLAELWDQFEGAEA